MTRVSGGLGSEVSGGVASSLVRVSLYSLEAKVGIGGKASREPGIDARMAVRSQAVSRSLFASVCGAARQAATTALSCT